MTRKQRADSTAESVRALRAGQIKPPPNVPLNDVDMPHFVNVIDEFARAEWTAHQLELAAMLARMMADLNREQQELRREGFIIERPNGTTVENPRARIVKSITGDIYSGRRSLAIHARARANGDNRNKATANSVLKDSQSALDDADNLLARPN